MRERQTALGAALNVLAVVFVVFAAFISAILGLAKKS